MSEQTNNRYFIYARKSSETEDRQILSIEAQINELQRLAEHEQLRVVDVLTESRSAKTIGRPVFGEMIRRIEKGEANGILCWKLDRLARNPRDGALVQSLLIEGSIAHIRAFDRSYYPSDNVLMMYVELGMATQYSIDLGKNASRGMKATAEKGNFPQLAPLGYKNSKTVERGNNPILVDEERFPLVRKLWDKMLTGHCSVPEVLAVANDELCLTTRPRRASGETTKREHPISRNTLYGMFRNPFYYGEYDWGGVRHKGSHKAMVTEEEYWRVQEILGRKGVQRPKTPLQHLYSGLIRCGACNGRIAPIRKEKFIKSEARTKVFTYYRCGNSIKKNGCFEPAITEEQLEAQIDAKLSDIEIPQEFYDWAMTVLREMNGDHAETRERTLDAQRGAYDQCAAKIDALIDMRAGGEIDSETFARKKAELVQERDRLGALLADTHQSTGNWLERADQYFSFAESARSTFADGGRDEKRGVLAAVGLNPVLAGGKFNLDLQKPLLCIKEAAPVAWRLRDELEPPITPDKQGELMHLYAKNPLLRARRDLNP